jgi:hypothetical protein
MNTLTKLIETGVVQEGQLIRLHLGCGAQYLPGYINIDYPASEHVVGVSAADVTGDITQLSFPIGSVAEIRLHHVFEHFNRITALALLVKWHDWLQIEGKLIIETPDLMKSAEQLVSDIPYKQKMAIVRHLEGDQAARWASHIGQWWDERFENTLSQLRFHILDVTHTQWDRWPYLCNITVTALKLQPAVREEQFEKCCLLLRDSMVSERESATFEVWKRQLRERLGI